MLFLLNLRGKNFFEKHVKNKLQFIEPVHRAIEWERSDKYFVGLLNEVRLSGGDTHGE